MFRNRGHYKQNTKADWVFLSGIACEITAIINSLKQGRKEGFDTTSNFITQ